jgi:hypothetical protein
MIFILLIPEVPHDTTGFIIIIIISFYSFVEHRARVKIRHLVLFAAKAFTSAQLFFHIKKLSCQIRPAFPHFGFFNHLGFAYVGD